MIRYQERPNEDFEYGEMSICVGGIHVQIVAPEMILVRTEAFFSPYYNFSRGSAGCPSIKIVVAIERSVQIRKPVLDIDFYLLPPALGKCLGVTQQFVRAGSDLVVEVDYWKGEIVLSGWSPSELELQLRLLLRDQLFWPIERSLGYIQLHGAAVSKNQLGVAFLGPRNAGKTTSLLSLLYHGEFDFVSADRIKLRCAGNVGVEMFGIPARCNVNIRCFEPGESLFHLRGLLCEADIKEGKFLVPLQELTRGAGVCICPRVPVEVIVFPRFCESDAISCVRISDRNRIISLLESEILAESTLNYRHVHWLNLIQPQVQNDCEAREAIIERTLQSVKVIEVAGTYEAIVTWFKAGSSTFSFWESV